PNTAGMANLQEEIVAGLDETISPKCIVVKGDSAARKLEGLEDAVECLRGDASAPIKVEQNGLTYFADLMGGQKTGWYYDQRDNHAFIAKLCMESPVLDLYTH